MDEGSSNMNGRSTGGTATKKELRRANADRDAQEVLAKRAKTRRDRRIKGPLFDEAKLENPLILYKSNSSAEVDVIVDPRLGDELQKHQREGVSRMYNVLSKYRNESYERGFILADGMGLGKTVQTISILWTLLTQSPKWDENENDRKPEISKAIVVCPKGVIHVWHEQIQKWLKPTGEEDPTNFTIKTEILDDKKNIDKKREVTSKFMDPSNKTQVLILSYETFVGLTKSYPQNDKSNSPFLPGPLCENTGNVVDLIILDEAHLIKNPVTQRCDAVVTFEVERKIALTGTPLQNDLEEYFTLIDYIQPGCLGDEKDFKIDYVPCIRKWVENKSDLTGKLQLEKLKSIVRPFFLRRTTNMFVEANKTEYIVYCKMHENEENGLNTQLKLYNKFVEMYLSAMATPKIKGVKKPPQLNGFQAIGFLKDVCSHPGLVYGKCKEYKKRGIPGAEQLLQILAENGQILDENEIDFTLSAKLRVLNLLLLSIKKNEEKNDRVVIVSYYTNTLRAIENYLKEKEDEGFYFVRYDGSTAGGKRKKIIEEFNNPSTTNQFIMTLSSRAGGCGISLVGANHLIMFDPDWNPANDEQAMCRIYREGQKKDCHIYRFVTTSSIEESIFHRQIVKKLLAGAVLNEEKNESYIFNFDDTPLQQQQVGKLAVNFVDEMSNPELFSNLFETIRPEDSTVSLTHDQLKCERCDESTREERTPPKPSVDEHSDSLQLKDWNHHFTGRSLPAECEAIQDAWDQDHFISFLFRRRSEGVQKKSTSRLSIRGNDLSDLSDNTSDSF